MSPWRRHSHQIISMKVLYMMLAVHWVGFDFGSTRCIFWRLTIEQCEQFLVLNKLPPCMDIQKTNYTVCKTGLTNSCKWWLKPPRDNRRKKFSCVWSKNERIFYEKTNKLACHQSASSLSAQPFTSPLGQSLDNSYDGFQCGTTSSLQLSLCISDA